MEITSLEVKQQCMRMHKDGIPTKDIHKYFMDATGKTISYNGFTSSLSRWEKKGLVDDTTLKAGTYPDFVAHDATVRVNAAGEITEAWIKQRASSIDPDTFIQVVSETVGDYNVYVNELEETSGRMLEIPFFDMHWGVAFFEDYEWLLKEIVGVIRSKHWDEIVIPFGQDFFHNDSIKDGKTTSGTVIQKVDIIRAVKDGKKFMEILINQSLLHSNKVKIIYSAGNHDMTVSWMFMQTLKAMYGPKIVDDSFEPRKCFTFGSNAVMVTHGNSKQATSKNLAHIFPVSFPAEFASATTREVHAGHLHHEIQEDVYGVMVRRLASAVPTDEWTNWSDFVGTHKRMEAFEWTKEKLAAVHYF